MNRRTLFVIVVLALVGYTAWTLHEVIHGPLQRIAARLVV